MNKYIIIIIFLIVLMAIGFVVAPFFFTTDQSRSELNFDWVKPDSTSKYESKSRVEILKEKKKDQQEEERRLSFRQRMEQAKKLDFSLSEKDTIAHAQTTKGNEEKSALLAQMDHWENSDQREKKKQASFRDQPSTQQEASFGRKNPPGKLNIDESFYNHQRNKEESTSPDQTLVHENEETRISFYDDDYDQNSSGNSAASGLVAAEIYEDYVIKNGDEVLIRITEPFYIAGQKLERNQLVRGKSSLREDRLQITVQSMMVNGQILPVTMVLYDTDGVKGLYAPDNSLDNSGGEVSSGVDTDASNAMNLPYVGNAVSALTRRKAREVKVPVSEGAKVYMKIMEKQ